MAGPTRLELATSCVTDKKHVWPNHRGFRRRPETKGFKSVSSVGLDESGCWRLIVGYPQKSPQTPTLGSVLISFVISIVFFVVQGAGIPAFGCNIVSGLKLSTI